jgi:FkbM family methyltransferase
LPKIVIEGLVADNEAIVKRIYNVLLGRDPEPGGLKHWTSCLATGLSEEDLLRSVVSSAEFRGRIGSTDAFNKFRDVDLIVSVQGREFRLPATDLSLVPHLLEHRSWEPHITRYLKRNLTSDDVFVDVGANLGFFTVLCAPLVSRVIAFEPVSLSHRYCKANVNLNGLTNVDLFQCGLWIEDTTVNIKADPSSLMAASISRDGSAFDVESIRCVSLDSMIARGEASVPSIAIMKMDIEGAELFALEGMKVSLEKFRPKIIMELNRPALARFDTTVADIWNFFSGRSYKLLAFKHWEEVDPFPVDTLEELQLLCPKDSLLDLLAVG